MAARERGDKQAQKPLISERQRDPVYKWMVRPYKESLSVRTWGRQNIWVQVQNHMANLVMGEQVSCPLLFLVFSRVISQVSGGGRFVYSRKRKEKI